VTVAQLVTPNIGALPGDWRDILPFPYTTAYTRRISQTGELVSYLITRQTCVLFHNPTNLCPILIPRNHTGLIVILF
jgi:hypothetical protein